MHFTFRPKYSSFALPSNILGIKYIEKTLDLLASYASCPVFCMAFCIVFDWKRPVR